MKIRRFLPALRIALLLAMADDCAGMKTGGMTGLQVTGVATTVNINAAASGAAEGAAQAGMDPAAGQKGATEVQGPVQHGCLKTPGREDVCW
jgi:hypothetical protein